ncbi:MAG: ATP-binding protein [Sphingomonadales bacterium]|nr:ATP-binding protein [Sphingomonadales bacterium]PIX66183.1 MAG: OLD family endonuclease [Sphingomonadales bacterium CG_4_10_14_3_um_filter_58_15]NCO49041.1 ATP-binding protein [Sphingomonadales bacterium]NCO99093.1 ATP-binding protein [Sphingomonadales bacterium]NCP26332.1 ATP-binding protein [Sphingomonadales bacterium]
MRLTKLELQNFRCYTTPFKIDFADITGIVGKNDAGKSTILDALAIFFGEQKMDQNDASKGGDNKNVRITCHFDDLPDQIVIDANFETNLKSEFLLMEDGSLSITKVYNGSLVQPKETLIAANAWHPSNNGLSDLHTLKRVELIKRANDLSVDLLGVNKAANSPIRRAIWDSAELQFENAEISMQEEGGKQIWAAMLPYLPTFALFKSDRSSSDQDPEAQDPLKAAIKDALKEVEPALLEITERVKAEVQQIADLTVAKIREMDPSLAETLNPIITTKKWDSLFQTNIVGEQGIPLNKRGSGIRRLVLLNFFRAKAEAAAIEGNSRNIIYAIEEPETSQHPRNQRILLSALNDLASADGRQVLVTTHTPMLARALPEGSLRFIDEDSSGAKLLICGGDENKKIADSLGVLPDHNVKVFIGVEGKHDIAFLKGASRILGVANDIPDLEAAEISGQLIFFPLGGSNLALWTSRLKELNRPELHFYDRDDAPPAPPKYKPYMDAINSRDGCSAICTNKRELENYLHVDAVSETYQELEINIELPAAFADFDDVPEIVAKAVHTVKGEGEWREEDDKWSKSKASQAKTNLNGLAIHRMTVQRFAETDPSNELISWLTSINDALEKTY